MHKKQLITFLVTVFFVGAIGSIFFNRLLIPLLSRLPRLSFLAKLESSAPLIINRTEVVNYNEGANIIDLTKQGSNSIVSVYAGTAPNYKFIASGFILASDGLVFTVKQVGGLPGELVVVLNDGTNYKAALRALDPRSDLAALTIDAKNLPVVQFDDASLLKTGQRILALGKTEKEFERKFASGLITKTVNNSASSERIFYSEAFEETFETDARLDSDFLGGVVLDLQGKMAGMILAGQKILISEDIKQALNSYLSLGKIVRPAFGIKYQVVSKSLAALKNLSQAGVQVVSVDSNSPAAHAGVIAGDLIIEADGRLLEKGSFEQILNKHSALDEMKFLMIRNGSKINLTVKLEPK